MSKEEELAHVFDKHTPSDEQERALLRGTETFPNPHLVAQVGTVVNTPFALTGSLLTGERLKMFNKNIKKKPAKPQTNVTLWKKRNKAKLEARAAAIAKATIATTERKNQTVKGGRRQRRQTRRRPL